MTKRFGWVALAALAATVGSAAHAQRIENGTLGDLLFPPNWADVRSLDVAGVSLGMTPEQARAALIEKGFQPRETDPPQDSWQRKLAQRLAQRGVQSEERSTVPMFTMAEGSQGERIEVWYAATIDGARVASVKYQMPTDRMQAGAFFDGIQSRYGRSSASNRSSYFYCSRNERQCMSPSMGALPKLVAAQSYHFFEVEMWEGTAEQERRVQAFNAAVEQGAPRSARPSF